MCVSFSSLLVLLVLLLLRQRGSGTRQSMPIKKWACGVCAVQEQEQESHEDNMNKTKKEKEGLTPSCRNFACWGEGERWRGAFCANGETVPAVAPANGILSRWVESKF